MAKAVPLRFVESHPKIAANNRPANAPTIGMRGNGTGQLLATIAFIACTAR